ncbi:MAG: GNAT family N-acetyltransferase [Paracoccaceae bacterium]
MAEIRLRPAVPGDVPALARLHAASWRDSYRGIVADRVLDGDLETQRRELWARLLARPAGTLHAHVAEGADWADRADPGNGLAGFALALPLPDGALAHLAALYVAARLRGCGIGDRLLRAIVRGLVETGVRTLSAEVYAEAGRARAFYAVRGAREGVPFDDPAEPRPDGRPVSVVPLAWDRAALHRLAEPD